MKIVFLLMALASDNNFPPVMEDVSLDLYVDMYESSEACEEAKTAISGIVKSSGGDIEYTCYPVVSMNNS